MNDFSDEVEPVRTGHWGATRWELFPARQVPPELGALRVTSVACVAIRNLTTREVVLTFDGRPRVVEDADGNEEEQPPQWEIPGGHLDPLNPDDPGGPREGELLTLGRENVEEIGYNIPALTRPRRFAYRVVYNAFDSAAVRERGYPEVALNTFYYLMLGNQEPGIPTDPSEPASGTFTVAGAERLVNKGQMTRDELVIVRYGLAAALQDLRDGR